MRRRFFVEQFVDNRAFMEGEAAHHLGRVLRAERGQLYELSDGHRVCLARIEEVRRDRIAFALIEDLPVDQPAMQTSLLLSIVKFDAFEFALEKATELGVDTIVPLAAARSEKGLLGAVPKRSERWRKILLEASQQPGAPSLRSILKAQNAPPAAATLAIGPEGGWTDAEFQWAHRHSFREASLGQLILRTETAVIAALASLNYALSSHES